MKLWKEEMKNFKEHSDHVKYHKEELKRLFEIHNSNKNDVICRWDFAENYVHDSASMVSSMHYGKEQSQMLIVSYWYHESTSTMQEPKIKLKYIAFTSDYLAHSTVFFNKCFNIFLTKIKSENSRLNKVYVLSDGAQQHFKNKRSYNNVSLLSAQHSKKCLQSIAFFFF